MIITGNGSFVRVVGNSITRVSFVTLNALNMFVLPTVGFVEANRPQKIFRAHNMAMLFDADTQIIWRKYCDLLLWDEKIHLITDLPLL